MNQIGDPNSGAPEQLNKWFNAAAFAVPTATQNTLPTERPGAIRGPGFWNTDFALRKVTRITEGTSIEMRFEAFNLLNHVNFANPVGDVADPNFGRISSIRTGSNSRLLQLGAKFSF